MKKQVLILSCLLLLFSGCTKAAEEEAPAPEIEIGGKTFYDTSNPEKMPSHVWFGKDGSFVLTDDTIGDVEELSGSWTIKEGVVTLDVAEGGSGKYTKIFFEAKDEETIILKSTLTGSKSEAVYSIHIPEYTIPDIVAENEYKVYYNASMEGNNPSHLELFENKDFIMVENDGISVIEIKGRYGIEGDVYMFSNFKEFKDPNGETVYNFEMMKEKEGVLVLREDLRDSRKGDVFSLDGKIPEGLVIDSDPFKDTFKTTTWIHEPIEDVAEQYLPSITIATDYSFKLIENCYAGMGQYQGYCQKTDDGWACDVTDASKMQGFKGDDVKLIKFIEGKDGSLILKTELCMSREGDVFKTK